MAKELLYYSNLPILFSKDSCFKSVPGVANYKSFSSYFDKNLFFLDRTNTITFPFKAKDTNPLPVFEKDFSLTYRNCAELRMQQLDKIHQQTGKNFRLLYSGGIDSSGIFASFIDYYGASKSREILEICCSKESIDENPWLWDKFIRKENFDLISSHDHNHYWNDNKITLMGEGNDQLFGRTDYIEYKNNKNLYTDISVDELAGYLNRHIKNPNVQQAAEMLIRIGEAAPLPITNTCLLVWWFNFNITWNGLMLRVLSHASSLPSDVLESGLVQFYNTDLFQQWSMKFHYDLPDSFANGNRLKPHCKDMIMDILNIPEYSAKGKFASFPRIHAVRPSLSLIDTELTVYKQPKDYLNFVQSNSFE